MGLPSFKFVQWAPKHAFLLQQSAFFRSRSSIARSMILVPIKSACATSYLTPIVTMVLSRLSCTVSEIWRLIG